MDMGHTGFQKKVNFIIYCEGTGKCPHSRKGQLLRLFGYQSDTPDLRKMESPKLLGQGWDMSGCRKKCIGKSV
jgi:hypothetical protein